LLLSLPPCFRGVRSWPSFEFVANSARSWGAAATDGFAATWPSFSVVRRADKAVSLC
jgi:hypothetical protein